MAVATRKRRDLLFFLGTTHVAGSSSNRSKKNADSAAVIDHRSDVTLG